ncbi:MAG TPA: amino acid ABC transporter substrate-binding protein [Bradyrhizobium sp.]|nr:amino acid ABC transporter substrate-binding protein [Bradyrhizobium sp.]
MKPLSLLPALFAALTVALTAPAHSAEPLSGTLKAIKERKAIRIGHLTDAYPMSFVGPGGEVEGYSIELCKRIAEEVGKTVGITPLKIEYVPTTLEGRFDAVASGKVDIECGTSTITLSRMERVDFTNMSFVDGGGLLVRKGSAINNVAGLVDETVAVIPGTTTEKSLRAALSRSFIKATVVPVKDHGEGVAAVASGKVSAYASDRVLLVGLLIKSQGPQPLDIAREQFSYEPYGFAIRRGDADFRLAANRTLARLYRSEDMIKIFEKWFAPFGKPGEVLVLMYALNALPE